MILITGATGFVGTELVLNLLETGKPIRCTRRSKSVVPPALVGKPVQWVEADLLDYFSLRQAFDGIEEVYHCAALISFRPADREKLRNLNREGTANVVNLCLECGVRKLVHVSSVAALGEARPGELVTEKDYWQYTHAQSGYSISKYEAEMEVWRGIAEGMTAVIVNPSVIIGKNAGENGSGKLFLRLKNGFLFYTEGSIGLVDVGDVAKLMIRLMDSDVSGERFILNAENLGYRNLFTLIANAFGRKPPFIRLYRWQLSVAARIISWFSNPAGLTPETAKSAFKRHEFSNKKILAAVPGFVFRPVAETVEEICR